MEKLYISSGGFSWFYVIEWFHVSTNKYIPLSKKKKNGRFIDEYYSSFKKRNLVIYDNIMNLKDISVREIDTLRYRKANVT